MRLQLSLLELNVKMQLLKSIKRVRVIPRSVENGSFNGKPKATAFSRNTQSPSACR